MDTRAVVEALYGAFAKRDGEAMAALYAPDGRFSDPAFPSLSGAEAGQMWRMLTSRGKDLRIEWRVESVDGERANVHWEAWYTFGGEGGRKVHNVIDAAIVARNGKIVEHTDRFDFWRWSRQALGPVGALLGWTPFLRSRVQKTAAAQLAKYAASRPG